MGKLVMRDARELGIESNVHVLDDRYPEPLVTVFDGRKCVQTRMSLTWLMDSSLLPVKQILMDMLRAAKKKNRDE